MFRGGCRYSIVILAITLLWAARRLSVMQAVTEAAHPDVTTKGLWTAGAVAACLLILWDQVPRAPTADETATIARQVEADREFTEKMESALPDAAMVFQLPVIDFPESPIPGVPPYDHFRPYLYSKNLRYSFGSMKGREREKWQAAAQALMFQGATLNQESQRIQFNTANFARAVDELKKLGFSAIYANRNGFPDKAKGLEDVLLELGYSRPPIRNATGDLVCIVLEKDANPTSGNNE
jgi:phosphoglycerol transferase